MIASMGAVALYSDDFINIINKYSNILKVRKKIDLYTAYQEYQR